MFMGMYICDRSAYTKPFSKISQYTGSKVQNTAVLIILFYELFGMEIVLRIP